MRRIIKGEDVPLPLATGNYLQQQLVAADPAALAVTVTGMLSSLISTP